MREKRCSCKEAANWVAFFMSISVISVYAFLVYRLYNNRWCLYKDKGITSDHERSLFLWIEQNASKEIKTKEDRKAYG